MHYQDPQNNLHFVDPEFAYLLPAGSVQITDAQAQAIRLANTPVVDPKIVIQAQINALEAKELLPRIVRDSLFDDAATKAAALGLTLDQVYAIALLPDAPTAAVSYKKLKDFDTQIAALRSQL